MTIWSEKLTAEVRTMSDRELLRLYRFVFLAPPENQKQAYEIIKGEIEKRGLESEE